MQQTFIAIKKNASQKGKKSKTLIDNIMRGLEDIAHGRFREI